MELGPKSSLLLHPRPGLGKSSDGAKGGRDPIFALRGIHRLSDFHSGTNPHKTQCRAKSSVGQQGLHTSPALLSHRRAHNQEGVIAPILQVKKEAQKGEAKYKKSCSQLVELEIEHSVSCSKG
jgi:hypothetical protein